MKLLLIAVLVSITSPISGTGLPPPEPALASDDAVLFSESVGSAEVGSAEWKAFKASHGKTYADAAEEARRLQAYAANKAYVARHNAGHARGLHTFTVALNKFADLTAAEFAARFAAGSSSGPRSGGSARPGRQDLLHADPLPAEVDWRQHGVVTPVVDQGSCTADWAFSAVGVLESARAVAGAPLEPLSAQQLVDCEPLGGEGCNGGVVHYALQYIDLVNGIERNSTYPFTGEEGKCHANQDNFVNDLDYFIQLYAGDEDVLQDAVANMGPITASVDARHSSFQLYQSGVYYEPVCSGYRVNHPILVVGYGALDGVEHWLVKNCWGTDWGEDGYIRMSRNRDNNCGISTEAYYVVVDLDKKTNP